MASLAAVPRSSRATTWGAVEYDVLILGGKGVHRINEQRCKSDFSQSSLSLASNRATAHWKG